MGRSLPYRPMIAGRADISAAIGAGNDLQEVPAGVLPVDAAAAVIGIDLALGTSERVRPVDHAAFADSTKNLVEPVLVDEERIVLRVHRTMVVSEVQRDVVVDVHDQERAVGLRLSYSENLGQKSRGLLLVAHRYDRVVQLDCHRHPPSHGGPVAWVARLKPQSQCSTMPAAVSPVASSRSLPPDAPPALSSPAPQAFVGSRLCCGATAALTLG